jgi:GNAT superfamily N-acetyltransferase
VGDTALEASGVREPTYSIILYPAANVPVQYEGFIKAKFKRSLRDGNDLFKLCDANAYFTAYSKYIDALLARPNSIIRLCVLTDSPDVALGWSLIENDVLHYVFVQRDFRNKGIGKALVPVSINWISHITHTGVRIWTKHKHVRLNPFA